MHSGCYPLVLGWVSGWIGLQVIRKVLTIVMVIAGVGLRRVGLAKDVRGVQQGGFDVHRVR
jgi:hypothetical protein